MRARKGDSLESLSAAQSAARSERFTRALNSIRCKAELQGFRDAWPEENGGITDEELRAIESMGRMLSQ